MNVNISISAILCTYKCRILWRSRSISTCFCKMYAIINFHATPINIHIPCCKLRGPTLTVATTLGNNTMTHTNGALNCVAQSIKMLDIVLLGSISNRMRFFDTYILYSHCCYVKSSAKLQCVCADAANPWCYNYHFHGKVIEKQ